MANAPITTLSDGIGMAMKLDKPVMINHTANKLIPSLLFNFIECTSLR